MNEQIKSFLNEDQDPKAIEKITAKLATLLMKNEEVGYIGVQKKPAVTIFPDSIVLTNKRIILCKPKNLGLSMDVIDYDWDDVSGAFVKENILGSEFSFSTKSDLVISIDYIPKSQARKLHIFAKEQMDLLKNPIVIDPIIEEVLEEEPIPVLETIDFEEEIIEETETEEVTNFAEIMPALPTYAEPVLENTSEIVPENKLSELSQDELFEKLQNYKKLLDNGLINQGEYEVFKKEILSFM
jgi:Bacterial PH domain